jgi:hypothetical protein
MSLQNTDLAAVSTGNELYLYYQQGTEIKEVLSKNGVDWRVSDKNVGDKCKVNGSSITAYYVIHEGGGDFNQKSTVRPNPQEHCLFLTIHPDSRPIHRRPKHAQGKD